MVALCLKCNARSEIRNPTPMQRRGIVGDCPICGTKLFHLGPPKHRPPWNNAPASADQ